VRKDIACIFITTNTLEETPNGREGRQETEEPGVAGVAPNGIVPTICVETKEEFDVLTLSVAWFRGKGGWANIPLTSM
jgi:hypothetical protein